MTPEERERHNEEVRRQRESRHTVLGLLGMTALLAWAFTLVIRR